MNTQPKIALCLIVKADDREAQLLDRCLGGPTVENILAHQKEIDLKDVEGLAKHVDGIFVTITGENEMCETVCKKYGAFVSHYKWDYSFANARNFNFKQVPEEYDYILWVDADDVIRNPKLIKEIVKKASQEATDSIVLKYKYDFDEYGNTTVEHLRVRIIKNDGCVVWVNDIHEDFQENRQLLNQLNKEVEIIHLTDSKRVMLATARNVHIAEIAVQKNSQDPHGYWNLANTYVMAGRAKDALPIYLKFIEISNSDEERFLSWHRLAGIYASLGDFNKAIEAELESLSLRPWYPDAYFSLGEFYYKLGKLRNAQEMVLMGFSKKVPELESIVWNPMDYEYNPNMLMAKIQLAMNKPREAVEHLEKCLKFRPKDKNLQKAIKNMEPEIKKFDVADAIYKKAKDIKDKTELAKLLDSVSDEMKYYPPIVALRNAHFVKETSSGKDVAILCSYTTHEWYADTANTTGVGGSEEAVIQLAKQWQKAGYNVTVFANTPKHQEYIVDGVTWKPYMGWNFRDKQDITIIWRHPKYLDFDINSDKIYVDIHDVIPTQEFNKTRILKATKIMFKSKVHRDYYPQIPDEKCEIIPHGLDIEEFDSKAYIQRNPYKILNTSSPDRGMKTSMKAVKLAYEKLPDDLKKKLKFAQYYGFDIWDADFANDKEMLAWKDDALKQMKELQLLGVMTEDSGQRVSQRRITKEYLEAGILLYPSNFFEIGFISGMKAMLAGCIPLTTDVFAQGEFIKGIKIHSNANYQNWVKDLRDGSDYGVENVEEVADKIVEYITNVDKYESMRQEIKDYAKTFTWEKTAEAWIQTFNK